MLAYKKDWKSIDDSYAILISFRLIVFLITGNEYILTLLHFFHQYMVLNGQHDPFFRRSFNIENMSRNQLQLLGNCTAIYYIALVQHSHVIWGINVRISQVPTTTGWKRSWSIRRSLPSMCSAIGSHTIRATTEIVDLTRRSYQILSNLKVSRGNRVDRRNVFDG